MLRLILDVLLLWKTIPVLLSAAGAHKLTKEIDQDGNDWTGPPGAAPGVAVVHPDQAQILLSAAGAFYAVRNLLSN